MRLGATILNMYLLRRRLGAGYEAVACTNCLTPNVGARLIGMLDVAFKAAGFVIDVRDCGEYF